MDGILRYATNVDVLIGPFIDDTDGKTAETGVAITDDNTYLSKNAGTLAKKNEATHPTHDALGYYLCKLDTTDTGTLGILKLAVHIAGALPVVHTWQIVPAIVYDAMYAAAGTDYLQVELASAQGEVTFEKVTIDANNDDAALKITNAHAEGYGVVIEAAGGVSIEASTYSALEAYCDDATNGSPAVFIKHNEAGDAVSIEAASGRGVFVKSDGQAAAVRLEIDNEYATAVEVANLSQNGGLAFAVTGHHGVYINGSGGEAIEVMSDADGSPAVNIEHNYNGPGMRVKAYNGNGISIISAGAGNHDVALEGDGTVDPVLPVVVPPVTVDAASVTAIAEATAAAVQEPPRRQGLW